MKLTLDIFRRCLQDYEAQPGIAYVQIFHNHGRDAGASAIHPHYQILATPFVPPGINDELAGCFHYHEQNHECIYCATMQEERHQAERIICETRDFMAIARTRRAARLRRGFCPSGTARASRK